ncbi:SpoIIE family protein phosphatase [Streptomyces himastatinicus]|uniref:SpoIIE family protein phosphatase n=1 Tax=Streptomyces himastatinicus TaxID=998084 RepID=UPI001FE1945D|nr:SpoIIE family protein phosphatase [Streptomyces himastatinicus]
MAEARDTLQGVPAPCCAGRSVGYLGPVPHRLTVITHGHIEPVLISWGKVMALSGPSSLPLGLGSPTDESQVPVYRRLLHGDLLPLRTDGLNEARDVAGAFYRSWAGSGGESAHWHAPSRAGGVPHDLAMWIRP